MFPQLIHMITIVEIHDSWNGNLSEMWKKVLRYRWKYIDGNTRNRNVPTNETCVRGWVSTTVPRVSAMFKFPDSSYFVLWNEERSSLWWRNGYRNWDDTGFKKRPQTQNLPFACIDWPMDVPTAQWETCSVLQNQLQVSFLTRNERYWCQLFTKDVLTCQETEPNGSMNLKACLRTGNFLV